jgi:DnaJ-class molecular chaperone
MTELYDVLNVNRNASTEEIKIAYKKKALECHPDKSKIQDTQQACDEFAKVRSAFDVLSDEKKRAAYDRTNTSIVNKPWINDIMLKVFAMATFPRDVVLDVNILFIEIYQQKCKKVDVKVKRWIDGTYEFATESVTFSLVNIKRKYTFYKKGDDSFMTNMSMPRGNIVINIQIIGHSSHIRIDTLFSDQDLFWSQKLSLYKFYSREQFNIELCHGITIPVTNTRKTSYIVHNAGLPLDSSGERSNIYINFELDIPLHLVTKDDRRLTRVLKKYFS